jgi:hypothetical protein
MPPFFMAPITLCLKGDSKTPADIVPIPEWEPATAIRSAKGPQPIATFSSIKAAAVQAPPAADDSPGSEVTLTNGLPALAGGGAAAGGRP